MMGISILLITTTTVVADTGCPEVPGQFVDGYCVQELDCEDLDCRTWEDLPKNPEALNMWRCSEAGELGYYRVNEQTSWALEYLYDKQGELVGVRFVSQSGVPICCEGQEASDQAWGTISGRCLSPVVEPNVGFSPEECPPGVAGGGEESESSGCAVGPGLSTGFLWLLVGAVLLGGRRHVV